jgi:hypothetical protein
MYVVVTSFPPRSTYIHTSDLERLIRTEREAERNALGLKGSQAGGIQR